MILVVEDEKALSRALTLKLTAAGYEVDIAEDGEVAIDKIMKNKYELIILDLILPIKDGFDILEQTKTVTARAPILVLSNLSQPEDIDRAKNLGAIEFFVKGDIQLTQVLDFIKKLPKYENRIE